METLWKAFGGPLDGADDVTLPSGATAGTWWDFHVALEDEEEITPEDYANKLRHRTVARYLCCGYSIMEFVGYAVKK